MTTEKNKVKQYKQRGKGQNHFRDKIQKELKVERVWFVPVCAFGIVYTVYSDNDCTNLIAEIIY